MGEKCIFQCFRINFFVLLKNFCVLASLSLYKQDLRCSGEFSSPVSPSAHVRNHDVFSCCCVERLVCDLSSCVSL